MKEEKDGKVDPFGPEQDILTTTGQISMKDAIISHEPLKIIPSDFF